MCLKFRSCEKLIILCNLFFGYFLAPSHQPLIKGQLIKGQYKTFERENFLISSEYNLSCRYNTPSFSYHHSKEEGEGKI